MWFPTQTKLDFALKKLLAQLAEPLLGAEEALNESRVFDSVLGPSIEYQEFFSQGERIAEGILSLLHGLRSGQATVGQVNTRMQTAKAMVTQYELQFQALTAARNTGAAKADKFFKGNGAPNQ